MAGKAKQDARTRNHKPRVDEDAPSRSPLPIVVAQASRGHEQPDYIFVEEFVERSGLSLVTVRRYIRDGKIPYIQPGGPRSRILIPRDVLEAYLAREPHSHNANDASFNDSPDNSKPTKNTATRRHGPVPRWKDRR